MHKDEKYASICWNIYKSIQDEWKVTVSEEVDVYKCAKNHCMTVKLIEFWMQISVRTRRFLNSQAAKRDTFWWPLSSGDESWVHHYILETKSSNMQWFENDETGSVKAKNPMQQFLRQCFHD